MNKGDDVITCDSLYDLKGGDAEILHDDVEEVKEGALLPDIREGTACDTRSQGQGVGMLGASKKPREARSFHTSETERPAPR